MLVEFRARETTAKPGKPVSDSGFKIRTRMRDSQLYNRNDGKPGFETVDYCLEIGAYYV
jgi:hypothetical protein